MPKEGEINMELLGKMNQILAPIEKNGELLGAGMSLLSNQWGFGQLTNDMENALRGSIHMPNLQNVMADMANSAEVRTAITALVAGYVGQNIGISQVEKIAGIAQKLATGFLIGRAASVTAYYATHSSEGCEITGNLRKTSGAAPFISTSNTSYQSRSVA